MGRYNDTFEITVAKIGAIANSLRNLAEMLDASTVQAGKLNIEIVHTKHLKSGREALQDLGKLAAAINAALTSAVVDDAIQNVAEEALDYTADASELAAKAKVKRPAGRGKKTGGK